MKDKDECLSGGELDLEKIETCEKSLALEDIVPDYRASSNIIRNYCWSRVLTSAAAAEPSLREGMRILDAGCGAGHLLKLLRDKHPQKRLELHGVDYNPNVEALRAEGFSVVTGDLRRLPFPDAGFDGVFCLDVLEHIQDFEKAVDELRRVVKPGGFAVICQPMETAVYKAIKLLVKGQTGKVQYWKDKVLGAHHHNADEVGQYVAGKFVIEREIKIPKYSPVKLSVIWVCRVPE